MAHFAKISENNIVLQVLTLDNENMLNDQNQETESVGQQYLETHNNWPSNLWIQTSYNTINNQHIKGGTAFRGNYAGIGYSWDSSNNIFWPPQPFNSWTKNTSTASWEAPITVPSITTYTGVWTQEEIDNSEAPAGTNAGDEKITRYQLFWDEDLYQSNNTRGWKARKLDDSIVVWNGTSWE